MADLYYVMSNASVGGCLNKSTFNFLLLAFRVKFLMSPSL